MSLKFCLKNKDASDTHHFTMTSKRCLYFFQVVDFVRKGHQVMVFVHARNATVRTGFKLFFLEIVLVLFCFTL